MQSKLQPRYVTILKLQKMLNRKYEPDKRNIILIDVDGCVLNNIPRQRYIIENLLSESFDLSSYLKSMKSIYKSVYCLLDVLGLQSEDYINLKEEFFSQFLTNSNLNKDILIDGADKAIKNFIRNRFEVWLITGRHDGKKDSMRKGTIETLHRYEINVDHPKINLIMKSSIEDEDAQYKRDIIRKISNNREINICAFIDNEGKNLLHSKPFLDAALLVRFESAQSEDVEFPYYVLKKW